MILARHVEFCTSAERPTTQGGKRYTRDKPITFQKLTDHVGERVERPPIWVMRQGSSRILNVRIPADLQQLGDISRNTTKPNRTMTFSHAAGARKSPLP